MYKLLKKLPELYELSCFLLRGLYYFITSVIGKIQWKKVKEHTALITVVILFFASARVLRWIDPTAGVFDAGVLQVIILALVKYAVFLLVTWSSFTVIWPDPAHFMKFYFKSAFLQLSPWQKILISCSIYCFLMFMLVLLSNLGI